MGDAARALAIQEEPGKVKLVMGTAERASGRAAPCVRRVPEVAKVKLSETQTFTIQSLAPDGQVIEVLVPKTALTLFKKHPLKKKTGDEQGRLAVKLESGGSAVFELSGKPGTFKFVTSPSRCSGPHHDDVHIEC